MENNKSHILIVDDDDKIRNLLKDYLTENHYIVSSAEDAAQAKERLKILKFDIIILDVMMPGQNGYDFTKEIKRENKTPIILLTAKGEVENRIRGLELGADDYLGKPFDPKELLLRIKNILSKKNKIDIKSKYNIGEAQIVLSEMLANPGTTYSRDEIGEISGIKQERSIDVMITRLRQKLEINPKNPKFLQTIRGAGYVLWIE